MDTTRCIEVWGEMACFTRPEFNTERVSYPIITPSAARAVYDAIYWHPGVHWTIEKIEVLKPIRWGLIKRNEVTCVASNEVGMEATANRAQRYTRFLRDVHYKIHATLTAETSLRKRLKIFDDRARRGGSYRQIYLGLREFIGYYRLPDETSPKPISVTQDLGRMFYDFDRSDPSKLVSIYYRARMQTGIVDVSGNVASPLSDEGGYAHDPLGALHQYYLRRAEMQQDSIPRMGWSWRTVPYVCVLNQDGTFLQFESTQEGMGADRTFKTCLVPQSVQRSSNIAAELLCDNIQYLFGAPDPTKKNPKRAAKQHAAYVERLRSVADLPILQLVEQFVSQEDVLRQVECDPLWPEIVEKKPSVITFRVGGTDVLDAPGVRERLTQALQPKEAALGMCTIMGKLAPMARLHYPVKGVKGASSTGARMVSFNEPSFQAYGQKDGGAQISEESMFNYTTALNELLAKHSQQSIRIGNLTLVFWSKRSTNLEQEFAAYWNAAKVEDDPRSWTDGIRGWMEALQDGIFQEAEQDNEFYLLGLLPNRSRIVLALWRSGTASECLGELRQHFRDIKIRDHQGRGIYFTPYRLVREVMCGHLSSPKKIKERMDKLQGLTTDFTTAAFDGLPYPVALYNAALKRLKVGRKDRDGNRTHQMPEALAVIKAYINRTMRWEHQEGREIDMTLDKQNPSVGYQMGRLLAVMNECQAEALGRRPNKGLADTWIASAVTSPQIVFGRILKLQEIYLRKLNVQRSAIYRNRLNSIMNRIEAFPTQLDAMEQGRFYLGFAHQSKYRKAEKAAGKVEEKL